MKCKEKVVRVAVDLLKTPRRPSAIPVTGKKTCTGHCANCPNKQKNQSL